MRPMKELSSRSHARDSRVVLNTRATRRCHWPCLLALVFAVPLCAEVTFTSPGLPPTHMDDRGRLVEDWGTIAVNVAGSG